MTKQKQSRSIPKFRRRAEARPDEVLDAALELFTKNGFSETKVEEIAKRAGISKGTLYLYFASKEELLEQLIKRAVVPVANNAFAMVTDYSGDPRQLISIMLAMLGVTLEDSNVLLLLKVIIREALVNKKIANMYKNEVIERVLPAIIILIKNGIDNGYLREVDAELSIRSIMGPIFMHIMLGEVFGVTPKDGLALDRLIENHLTILFDGISTGKEAG